MNKDGIIYYSIHCENSKNLIKYMKEKDLIDKYIFKCIEDKNFKIPAYLNSVPTLITQKKEIYIGDSMINYFVNKHNIQHQINNNIDPFSLYESSSCQYTFLSEDKESYDINASIYDQNNGSKFKFLDTNQIIMPQISNNENKINDSSYENYINERSKDDEVIKMFMEKQKRI